MVTINMWVWGTESIAEEKVKLEATIFRKMFPDIEIKISLISWHDAWDSIMNAANEAKGPDILQVGSTWNATLAYLGVIKDLTREFKDSNLAEDIFVPAACVSCHFPNSAQVSSVPWFVDIRAMYYRKDIFEKLGMSADNLYDWTSFKQTCDTIAKFKQEEKSIEVLAVSGQQEALLLQNIAPWIWAAGGDFLTPDGIRAACNTQEVLDGLEFYISLISKGYIPLSILRLNEYEINERFFIKGAYAMAIPGPLTDWNVLDPNSSIYAEEVTKYCIPCMFPEGPAGRFTFCGGSNLAITSFSRYPREAWEFIKFLVSYESQNRYARGNKFPSLLESFDSLFMKEELELGTLIKSWKYGRSFPNVASWGSIESLLIQCFGKIFARVQEGDYDMTKIRTDLDQAALDVDSLLAR
ncbi:MAG: extracellular solute-binding protein [bacterium]